MKLKCFVAQCDCSCSTSRENWRYMKLYNTFSLSEVLSITVKSLHIMVKLTLKNEFIKYSLMLIKLKIWKELLISPYCLTVGPNHLYRTGRVYEEDINDRKTTVQCLFLVKIPPEVSMFHQKKICFLFITIPVQN